MLCKERKSAHGKHTEEQGEKYILIAGIEPFSPKCKIERNLGDQREQKQTQRVFLTVVRMGEAFHEKKTENRKAETSDHAHGEVRDVEQPVSGNPVCHGFLTDGSEHIACAHHHAF